MMGLLSGTLMTIVFECLMRAERIVKIADIRKGYGTQSCLSHAPCAPVHCPVEKCFYTVYFC